MKGNGETSRGTMRNSSAEKRKIGFFVELQQQNLKVDEVFSVTSSGKRSEKLISKEVRLVVV